MTAQPQPPRKAELRAQVRERRARRHPREQHEAAELLADRIIALAHSEGATTVASYLSMKGEPGTGPLLSGLQRLGVTILLPILTEDFDLDWATLRNARTRRGRLGLREPTGPPLGSDAVRTAGLIVCPGVAGSPRGERLGRGGGSYDRALARSLPATPRCLLLYDDELVDAVPTEPHDQGVDIIVTPSRLVRASPRRL